MFRLIFIIILLVLPLQSIASLSYTVKLTAYNNLRSLQKKLNKFPPALRKTVRITQRGKLYIATTLPTPDKKILQKLLPSYKKVFSDAFIATYKRPKTTSIEIKEKLSIIKQKEISFYDKIQQKTLYLCSHGKAVGGQKLLIRVAFTKREVSYTPIIGKIPPAQAEYKIENDKLYLFQKGLFNPKIYSKLEKTLSNYYLISSWIEKRKINTIRYYFNLADAKAYIKSLQ